MGCFIGESLYRTGDCSAVIVSHGNAGEERTDFPGDVTISVTILKTADGCGSVGGGTCQLWYWDGSAWKESNRTSPGTFQGYCYVTWTWSGAPRSWWWKLTWNGCDKVFKTGSPSGYPCEKYVSFTLKSIDPITKSGIKDAVLYLKPKNTALETLWCRTGADGMCTITKVCASTGYDFSAKVPGYEGMADYIVLQSDQTLVWPTATTPPSIEPPTVGPEELDQERTERKQADSDLGDKIEGALGTIAYLQGKLAQEISDRAAGILDLEARLKAWISEFVFELLMKNLNAAALKYKHAREKP